MISECGLDRRQCAVLGRHCFDGGDFGAVGLHREDEARAYGFAVEQDRARTAHAVFAAEMCSGEAAIDA